MNATKCKSHAFDLSRKGDVIVIAKHKDGVVDGIVTGLIVDVLGLPVLLAGLFMGILMLVGVVRGEEFKINPKLDHFASPPVVHAVFVIFAALLGLLFASMAVFLLWGLWQVQSAVFPYTATSRGHITTYGRNGSITVTERTSGTVVFQKPGGG